MDKVFKIDKNYNEVGLVECLAGLENDFKCALSDARANLCDPDTDHKPPRRIDVQIFLTPIWGGGCQPIPQGDGLRECPEIFITAEMKTKLPPAMRNLGSANIGLGKDGPSLFDYRPAVDE